MYVTLTMDFFSHLFHFFVTLSFCGKIIKIKLTKIHYDINILTSTYIFIRKKHKNKINKITADSCILLTLSSFLKVFYGRTAPRISGNFLENILGLVYFIERLQNESFPKNFLISLRPPLEWFYCATINLLCYNKQDTKMKQMKPSPVYIMKIKYKRKCSRREGNRVSAAVKPNLNNQWIQLKRSKTTAQQMGKYK